MVRFPNSRANISSSQASLSSLFPLVFSPHSLAGKGGLKFYRLVKSKALFKNRGSLGKYYLGGF